MKPNGILWFSVLHTALINSTFFITVIGMKQLLMYLPKTWYGSCWYLRKKEKHKQNFSSTTDSRHFKIKTYVYYCKHWEEKNFTNMMNVSYNRITKLIIPQKTSENMDNLQIDLFSKTLPADWNAKMLEYNS